MSGFDELTPAQVEELRADLVTLEGALAEHLGQMTNSAKAVDLDTPIGRLSRMDALAQQQVAKAGKEATRARLGQVRAACTSSIGSLKGASTIWAAACAAIATRVRGHVRHRQVL